jgi:hypothetical protein
LRTVRSRWLHPSCTWTPHVLRDEAIQYVVNENGDADANLA